jgi:hypothetical protein
VILYRGSFLANPNVESVLDSSLDWFTRVNRSRIGLAIAGNVGKEDRAARDWFDSQIIAFAIAGGGGGGGGERWKVGGPTLRDGIQITKQGDNTTLGKD